MPTRNIERFDFPVARQPAKREVAALHAVLAKLRIPLAAPDELRRGEVGEKTKEAVKEFQRRSGLRVDGVIGPKTLAALQSELTHRFFARSKPRTAKLHELLGRLGYDLGAEERKGRLFGSSTAAAIEDFQRRHGLAADGRMSPDLFAHIGEAALDARFTTKTQTAMLQRKLVRAIKIGKLGTRVDPREIKQKAFGPTTKAAIQAFQRKYGLDETGKIDPETFERLQSVAASRPGRPKLLKVRSADTLALIPRRPLRLNMNNERVGDLQRTLAFLGHAVAEKEFATRTFGRTTRAAVMEFQRARGLAPTGHVEGATLDALRTAMSAANRGAATSETVYHLRGSLRDDLWQGKSGLRVQVWERGFREAERMLGERRSLANGFYDVPYAPPRNAVDGRIKTPFHLSVRVLDAAGHLLGTKRLFNPTPVVWANFTDGNERYRGACEYDRHMGALTPWLRGVALNDVEETAASREITHIASTSGLAVEVVTRLVLAHRISVSIGAAAITPDVVYAFLGQSLPPDLPGDLLGSTEGWTIIDAVVERIARGVVFMEPELQAAAFDGAAADNLIPIGTVRRRAEVLGALAAERRSFALEKPLLTGNGSLAQVLAASSVPAASHPEVAQVMLARGGMGTDFWAELHARAAALGGESAIADFEATAKLGEITKHHDPTLRFVKSAFSNPAFPVLNKVSDCAKLDPAAWRAVIDANGGQVPAGIEGDDEQRKNSYAASLAVQSERSFPGIALAAEVDRGGAHGLTKLSEVRSLLDDHPDLDLHADNLHAFFERKGVTVASDTLGDLEVLQRVHRLAPGSKLARALIEGKLNHSAAVVFRGQDALTRELATRGVDRRSALAVYARAELQYAQVLARLAEFRSELHRADTRAIVNHLYTAEEREEALGDLASIESLFGPTDFCDCEHCASVYSPAAYLADVLRFLEAQPSEVAGTSVRDVLLGRRSDIANIELSCANTSTPMPYVDLVCEILEAAVPAPSPARDFSHQSTWTAQELRAFPEHVRTAAYDVLRSAGFPMDVAFDLWEEESRLWLEHLGVPRHELMELLQARPTAGARAPADVSIAGEYFGISSHETALITEASPSAGAQQALWGFDPTRSKIGVREVLDHGKLDSRALEYRRLLELVQVDWINAPGAPGDVAIERPASTCDLAAQSVIHLTLARLDRIHRFLRLWRRTGWEMWQLDLLIRAPRIGNGSIDASALVRLYELARAQKLLRLPFESALALFYELNTEERTEPDDPTKVIQPLYARLFQNRAVSDPVDPGLALPLDPSDTLAAHAPALRAAFGTTDADLTRVVATTDGTLTLANLSRVYAHLTLARSLDLPVERILQLQELAGIGDLFATPRALLDFVELHGRVRGSGLEIGELDYVLSPHRQSPYGMRAEAVVRVLEGLRETLRTAATDPVERHGQIAEKMSALLALTPERARLLLERVSLAAPLISVLDDERLAERDPADPAKFRFEVNGANFPDLFEAVELLHKITFLLDRQRIVSTEDLAWLLEHHAAFGLLGPAELPVRAPPAAPLLPRWVALTRWLELVAQFPEPEGTSLRSVLSAAAAVDGGGAPATPIGDLHAALSALTQWPVGDLEALHASLQLEYGAAANDYLSIETYLRLARAMQAVTRLGVSAALAGAWARRDDDATQSTTAAQTREAAKAKYDYAVWLEKAAPLQDVIRDRKRKALGRYLVERSLRTESPMLGAWRNPAYWTDEEDLLRYFLIDVEMSPCQLTSRIKQAMASAQTFVQRCLLNLERPRVQVSQEEREDSVSPNSWRQWKYMKSYRVWEAARKIFLYPENWIQPELRDDKSPFFEELEAELAQAELTHDHAEACLRHYLEKVHEVSRLELVGAYHELDDEGASGLAPAVDVLHVVARTRSDPARYYYRAFDLNDGSWSAWERIDADITGDHLLPVVYNRKLYLFWLVFTEKPQKNKKQPPARASDTPRDSPEPPKVLEIQLAWSLRQDDGWTPKSISREKLFHPWERPLHSYHLKSRYKSRENLLWLDLYVSTSREFNDSRFYDPFKDERHYLSAFRFDERGRPWHSSSFLFDGAVVGVKMKPLRGFYHLVDASGAPSDTTTFTTSHTYVSNGFGEAARAIGPLVGRYEIAPRLMLPDGMHYRHNRLANDKAPLNPNRLCVIEHGASRTLLNGARSPFELVFSQAEIQFDTAEWGAEPILYQDPQRSFFIRPELETRVLGYNTVIQSRKYSFFPFYHPYTALFLRELNRSGVDGLLQRRLQRFPHAFYPGNDYRFSPSYAPVASSTADVTAERDSLDFERYGAYSVYDWEIFFHAPLLIACRLSENQRFEEAMRWFHYIFDPTNVESLESPQRFWVMKPFFDRSSEEYRRQRIENLLRNLNVHLEEVRAWRNDPFNPHRLARHRPVAYQKTVVMKYIDNLIAWGDQLFRRDTLESLNEATTLYLLAYEILGPRPVRVPGAARQDRSYAELIADGDLDPLGNKSVPAILENLIPPPTGATAVAPTAEPLPLLDVPYFCIPPNEQLLEYWDRVEDRLFKLRHCMNIEGVVRQLPLFEPPINPALLVKAAAAGVDLGSVLSLTDVDPGQYRFRTLIAKALEYCGEVRALGEKLLSIIEKRDAEALTLLRASHETKLLEVTSRVRKLQIAEAQETIAGLERAKAQAEARRDYYQGREFINTWEGIALGLQGASALAETAIAAGYVLAGGLKFIPTFVLGGAGFGGSPTVHTHVIDGMKIGDAAEAAVKTLRAIATSLDKYAGLASTMGSYTRRQDDWDHQERLAELEIAQLDRQIAAAELRHAMAERELENIELQVEQSKTVEDYYRTKYTSEQLYGWMLQQTTSVYFRAYKLAFDMGLRAQKCLRLEVGQDELAFLEFGYWDSLKKGLLAGEKLGYDLRRMEAANLELNKRELELTKHVSLASVMPLKLVELKATGACDLELPEWLFDMDYPGHYRRRIRSVSITIPCVTGPYTGVHSTLSLVAHGVRAREDVAAGYGDPLAPDGPRFTSGRVPVTSMATSDAQNDAGVFELNFNDERFLPFEGAGAVSRWRLTLPAEGNQFDRDSISDVVMHLRYSATQGGTALTNAAKAHLAAILPTAGVVLLDLEGGFASSWQQFLAPAAGADQQLWLELTREHFPFHARSKTIRVTGLHLFLDSTHGTAFDVVLAAPGAAPGAADPAPRDPTYGGAHHLARAAMAPASAIGTWLVQIKKDTAASYRELAPGDIDAAYLVLQFSAT